jgi:hypothetical protein
LPPEMIRTKGPIPIKPPNVPKTSEANTQAVYMHLSATQLSANHFSPFNSAPLILVAMTSYLTSNINPILTFGHKSMFSIHFVHNSAIFITHKLCLFLDKTC